MRSLTKILVLTTFALAAATAVANAKKPRGYVETKIVSNLDSENPVLPDPVLKNPWGIAFIPGGPIWINDNGTGLSTLYTGDGTKVLLEVTIPPPSNDAGATATPTGIVCNGNPLSFLITGNQITASALFIFATEDGTISAWNGNSGTSAQLVKDETDPTNGAVYKGLAQGVSASKGILLYATNFRSGHMDVFDANFALVALGAPGGLPGSFADSKIPAGFAPFGIANINGDLMVTYAMQDSAKHDDVAGNGSGFVDVFTTDGNLIRRFATRSHLNSPWGIVRAGFNFGTLSNDLLIGNFGDGEINAFNDSGKFVGQLDGTDGKPLKIDGLWGLSFGGAAAAGPDTLYFTAGLNDEADGLFGSLIPNQ